MRRREKRRIEYSSTFKQLTLRMKERKIDVYGGTVKPIKICGKTVMWELGMDGAFELPFKTKPTEGELHDYKSCEDCIKIRANLITWLSDWFNGNGDVTKAFPNCCKGHAKLKELAGFNRVSFLKVPEITADKIIFTYNHILNHHKENSYYKEITDYITYTVMSFGQIPSGYGVPLLIDQFFDYLIRLVDNRKDIEAIRKKRIIEFVKAFETPREKKTNMNILMKTYEKWLKIFPFDISFFKEQKAYFEQKIPFLYGKPEFNKYLGLSKMRMHTKSSLIDTLLELTDELLTKMNSYVLYEKGLLNEPDQLKLEMVLNARKLKLQEGYRSNSQNEESQYRKILKEWFADEKEFIDDVSPMLKKMNKSGQSPNTEILISKLNQFNFDDFLIMKEMDVQKIYYLIEKHSGKEQMPYCVALLSEIGYLKYFYREFSTNKTDGNKKLSEIFNCKERRIRGNVNILNDRSKEDPVNYTSYKFIEMVKKELKGL